MLTEQVLTKQEERKPIKAMRIKDAIDAIGIENVIEIVGIENMIKVISVKKVIEAISVENAIKEIANMLNLSSKDKRELEKLLKKTKKIISCFKRLYFFT
ncbi:MAG: hypothetical protein ACP6IU_12045 [Candidatus Asgardarchaeia archaeon]